MDQLCRLCLSTAVKLARELDKEPKLLDDLSCFNIQIIMNESLPTFVCVTCMETLEIMIKFKENVLLNQCKLLNQLKNTKDIKKCNQYFKQEVSIKVEASMEFYDKDMSPEIESNINCYEEYNACKSNSSISLLRKSQDHPLHKKRKLKVDSEEFNTEISDTNTSKNLMNDSKKDSLQTKIEMDTVNINPNQIFYSKLRFRKCLTCLTNLPSRKELIEHYITAHTSNETSKTQITLVGKNNQENIKEESKIYPDGPRIVYVCKICDRTFPSVTHIVGHGRAHSESNLYCSHGCGYSTAYPGALRDHEKRHQKEYKYKCLTCGAGFHVKTWHDQHQNIHKNVKPFVCDLCGLAFHMDRYLKTHRLSVHSDVIKGVKRFMCSHCDTMLDNIKEYKKHSETHNGKKVYLCDTCGKNCGSSKQLQYHKNTHLGLKPYKCGICNKSFAKKHNLTVHSRAHMGLKYLCTTCGTHFAQRSTLHRHMKKFHAEKKKSNSESAEPVEVQNK